MANTRGRQVVLLLTNKSAAAVAAGDVVVFDTTTDESFTTTTTGRAEISVGVAQETIAVNALGRILASGYAALVNVPAAVTRGHYIESHTVAKQATGSATRRSGSFGQFGKSSATPSAWLWGSTDQTASGSGITVSENHLTADTALTKDIYGDGPSLSLAAGSYLLDGHVSVSSAAAGWITAQLLNGATQIDASDGFVDTGTAALSFPVSGYVVLASTTTVKIQVAANGTGGGTIRATPATNATGLTSLASYLRAVKIA